MVTKDKKEIRIGDWIFNNAGIYEVIEIHAGEGKAYAKEVEFSEADAGEYRLGDELAFSKMELKNMERYGSV